MSSPVIRPAATSTLLNPMLDSLPGAGEMSERVVPVRDHRGVFRRPAAHKTVNAAGPHPIVAATAR